MPVCTHMRRFSKIQLSFVCFVYLFARGAERYTHRQRMPKADVELRDYNCVIASSYFIHDVFKVHHLNQSSFAFRINENFRTFQINKNLLLLLL